MIRVKPDVDFGTSLAPAGARILEVLKHLAGDYPFDLIITSSRDGTHSGPDDPHHSGEAFDIRTHHLTPEQKRRVILDLQAELYRDPRLFFVQIESLGGSNEHIHIQRRKGHTYTIMNYLEDL